MPSMGVAFRNTAVPEANDNEYQPLFPTPSDLPSAISLFLESHCHPPRNSHHWLSFHIASSWLPLISTILPASNIPILFLGPLDLLSFSKLAYNFQAFTILLGQKWVKCVLLALFE